MEGQVVVAVTNFESATLNYHESSITPNISVAQLVKELANIIKVVLSSSKIKRDQLFGVGVGLAGVIHSNEGIVHHSPYFGWRDVPLAHLLEQKIQRPVYIENDVNTLTLTEQLFGIGRHSNNFLVMTVGRGIGLGIVINSQLYQGTHGGAGEFGHTVLVDGTTPDYDAKTLERLAADPAVVAHIRQMDAAVKTLADVVALADAGSQEAQQALARSGHYIGLGLANMINTFNPELIIISGEGTIANDYRLPAMMASLEKHTFDGMLEDVKIVVEPTNDQAWARGAATLVISKVFESPISEAKYQQ